MTMVIEKLNHQERLDKLCQIVEDFDIRTISDELEPLYKDYEPSYVMLNDFSDYEGDDSEEDSEQYGKIYEDDNPLFVKYSDDYYERVHSCQYIVDNLMNNYEMGSIQFRVLNYNGIESVAVRNMPEFWVDGIATLVPGYRNNLAIIDETMKSFGYVRVKCKKQRLPNGKEWFNVVYNPREQKDIKDMIIDRQWLHFSPDYNYDSIMENGIMLSKGNENYTYPEPRVYFLVKNYGKFGLPKQFVKMMQTHSRAIRKKDKTFEGDFNQYEIRHDVISDYKFFWDPNAQDCVFVTKNIPVDAIKSITEIKFMPY